MPRRRVVAKREILPDPKFHNQTVAKFINHVMVSGKKAVAERIVYGAFDRIEERETRYPNLSYELIPRAATTNDDGVVWERSVQANLPPDRVEKIYQNILDSDFEALTTAEANFGRFVTAISLDQVKKAKTLRTTLADYLGTLD